MNDSACSQVWWVKHTGGAPAVVGSVEGKDRTWNTNRQHIFLSPSRRLLTHWIFILFPSLNFPSSLDIAYQTGCGVHDQSQILLFPLPPPMLFLQHGGSSRRVPTIPVSTRALPGVTVNPVCCFCSTICMEWVGKPQESLPDFVMKAKTCPFPLSSGMGLVL